MNKRLVLLLAILCCFVGCAREAPPPHAGAAASYQTSAAPKSTATDGAKPQPEPPPPPPGQPSGGAAGKIAYVHHIPQGIAAPAGQASAESTLQQQIQNWYQHLGTGSIQYEVPTNMFWKDGSTVTVEIAGPKGASNDLKGATGSSPLSSR